jgi:hypothetical protein
VIVDHKTFHSLAYNRSQKCFDSLVKLKDNRVGFIHVIYAEGKRNFALFEENKLILRHHFFVLENGNVKFNAISPKFIDSKMIYVDTDETEYCMGYPNKIEVE